MVRVRVRVREWERFRTIFYLELLEFPVVYFGHMVIVSRMDSGASHLILGLAVPTLVWSGFGVGGFLLFHCCSHS